MDIQQLKNKTLKISVIEGIFASAMTGFTQEYFTPFLLLIGGTVSQVGLLSALPNFCASLIQLKSAGIVERLNSRKKTVMIFVLLQAIIFIPMIAIAVFRYYQPLIFIGLVILFACCGSLANPAWGSLMSDLVDKDKRGLYLGWRTRVLGFTTVIAMFIAGLLLYVMKKIDVFMGFAFLFVAAFLWRLVSWYFLRKMYEPSFNNNVNNYFSLFQFLSRLRESNFAKFVFFVSLMSFSVNISAPFFAVFMLRELNYNFFLYTVVTLTSTVAIYCSIARWGRHADRVGNLKVIQITAPFIGCIPLLWIINHSPVYLILIQIFSGFLWAGFNICTTNFIYDAVSSEKRMRCIAYFNTINGIALSCGALMGGFLLPLLPSVLGYRIITLFIISSLLRIIVGIFLPRKLKEVRSVEKIKNEQLFFSMMGIRPILGVERKTIRF